MSDGFWLIVSFIYLISVHAGAAWRLAQKLKRFGWKPIEWNLDLLEHGVRVVCYNKDTKQMFIGFVDRGKKSGGVKIVNSLYNPTISNSVLRFSHFWMVPDLPVGGE